MGISIRRNLSRATPRPFDANLRLLVAEDNAINRLVVTRMLARLGVTADLCTNGHEAVERATTSSYDLILMDVHMPVMDGLEAALRIRALQRGEKPARIIAFTANVTDEAREACRAAGMDGFLAKPYTMDELARSLAEHITPPDEA